jgi:hypothetical protein
MPLPVGLVTDPAGRVVLDPEFVNPIWPHRDGLNWPHQ